MSRACPATPLRVLPSSSYWDAANVGFVPGLLRGSQKRHTAMPSGVPSVGARLLLHLQDQAVDALHADTGPGTNGAVHRTGPPEGALHEHAALGVQVAPDLAREPDQPHLGRPDPLPSLQGDRHAEPEEEEAGD